MIDTYSTELAAYSAENRFICQNFKHEISILMKYILTLPLLAIFLSATAQSAPDNPEYRSAVEIALGELQKGQCKPCLEAYERAFSISQHSTLSYLRAARCAQMCHDATKAKAFANKAVEISAVIATDILQNNRDYPELALLQNSELGKKILKKKPKR